METKSPSKGELGAIKEPLKEFIINYCIIFINIYVPKIIKLPA